MYFVVIAFKLRTLRRRIVYMGILSMKRIHILGLVHILVIGIVVPVIGLPMPRNGGSNVDISKLAGDDKRDTPQAKWDKIILPNSSYLIVGDVGTGKSGLAYWLLERFSAKYHLQPATVGLPANKRSLLPESWSVLDTPEALNSRENVIAFIDEADIQLSIEDIKVREQVINFLSLPRQRKQILLLCFHFPRLVMSRYLPFFSAFLLKRPPYLLEFASKSKGDALYQMMVKAEERFAELVPPDWTPDETHSQPEAVLSSTYVVAPRLRWQGVLTNPTCSFWSQELSEIWAGAKKESSEPQPQGKPKQTELFTPKEFKIVPEFEKGVVVSFTVEDPLQEYIRSRTKLLAKIAENFPTVDLTEASIGYDQYFAIVKVRADDHSQSSQR